MRKIKAPFRVQFSIILLLLLVISAAFPRIFARQSPVEQNLELRYAPVLTPGHVLGTDGLGRDLWARLVHGSRSVIIVGVVSSAVALILGFIAAIPASFGPRWLQSIIMILMDGILAIPAILLAIAIVAVFGYGLWQVMISLGIIFSPLLARLIRAELQKTWRKEYVEAELLLNRSPISVFFGIALPEILNPVMVQLTRMFAAAVIIEASLSFLGIGIQPPTPSWGIMLNDARDAIFAAPWLALPPGIALALTVFSLNVTGDYLSEK